jgi:hypothetical protein
MKSIRFLKKAVAGALSAGATLFIAACYGPMENGYQLANGSVTVPEGQTQDYNVQVCAELAHHGEICSGVWNGTYYIDVYDSALDDAQLNGYRLCANDPNGMFIEQCVNVAPDSGITQQDFHLEFSPLD